MAYGSDSRAMGYIRDVTRAVTRIEHIWYLETLDTDGDPSGKTGIRAYVCAADNETPSAQLAAFSDISPRTS